MLHAGQSLRLANHCVRIFWFVFLGERIELTTKSLRVEPLNWQPLHVNSLDQKVMMQPISSFCLVL
jgi:hypothetical protein